MTVFSMNKAQLFAIEFNDFGGKKFSSFFFLFKFNNSITRALNILKIRLPFRLSRELTSGNVERFDGTIRFSNFL